jgi:hypothetical protein
MIGILRSCSSSFSRFSSCCSVFVCLFLFPSFFSYCISYLFISFSFLSYSLICVFTFIIYFFFLLFLSPFIICFSLLPSFLSLYFIISWTLSSFSPIHWLVYSWLCTCLSQCNEGLLHWKWRWSSTHFKQNRDFLVAFCWVGGSVGCMAGLDILAKETPLPFLGIEPSVNM